VPSKNIFYVVAGLVILVLVGYSIGNGHSPRTASEWLTPIGPAVTLAGVMLWLWDRFIWRWPVVRSIAGRPVLHGTWHGELVSDACDEVTGIQVPVDSDVYLVIRQRFWSVSARLLTKDSASLSLTASFKADGDGVQQLLYVYRATPRPAVQLKSKMHLGAVVLDTPRDGSHLQGRYFTDRKSGGELRFSRRLKPLVETHAAGRQAVAAANTPKK
jgi:SMODS-associating 2TM, beta-strand rich effector domain